MTGEGARIREWRHNPVTFVRQVFGVEPDVWQAEALQLFATTKRIAMKACKGPGKTTVLAWIIWNFLVTRPDSNVAATSISGANLKDGLWKELAKWHAKSKLLQETFDWQQARIVSKESPATWWASARQWAKDADAARQADTLAGLHADYMLFVIDESGGVPRAVAATAEAALASGIETKLAIAGNPTHTEGPLWDACSTHRRLWEVVEITADPDSPRRTPRVSAEWARQQIEMYGRDNPWVLVNVFGEFPPSSINALLGPDEVNEAMRRQPRADEYSHMQKRLGVDVARFGDDRTVIFPRQGLRTWNPVVMRNARTTDITARIMLARRNWEPDLVMIDDTGHWGHGVIDSLHAARVPHMGVQYHAPAIDKRYKNRRAEMWLEMAEWIKRGGALPQLPELISELTSPTYTFVNGTFLLEDKDAIKDRLGRSPDLADALALTFAYPDAPSSMGGMLARTVGSDNGYGRMLSDWDPLAN